MLKTKRVALDLKKTTREGLFEGLVSPYNYIDEGQDLVEPGAYGKTLQEKGPTRPILWQHNHDEPLGTIELQDRDDGLYGKGQLVLSVPQAKAAYDLIVAGAVTGLSIGYTVVRDSIENGVRRLKELRLWEISIVTMPMADLARISSIKSLDHSRIETALKSFRDDILRELKGNR
jgi:uncharacterized protein